MRQVLYVGASGFVGTRLIDITKEQYKLKNLDKQQSHYHPDITVIGDVRNQETLIGELHGYDSIVLLAAEHRDDVSPISLYYDVNVQGAKNVLAAMDINNINHIIFTSSVAIYGLNKKNPTETDPADPFNHYGKSKWQAEEILREWYKKDPQKRTLTIIRPTVIFGEQNRGNVYNLLKQIASGRFVMIGKGKNKKSMAYVGNIASFISYCIGNQEPGCRVYNYVDKPDFNMNNLITQVETSLSKKLPSFRIPYPIGLMGGLLLDIIAKISGKKFAVSMVRVRKFCATTQFDASAAHTSGFKAPYTLSEGLHRTLNYEFTNKNTDKITFASE